MRSLSARLSTAVHYVVRCQRRLPAVGRVQLQRDGRPDLPLALKNISRSGFMAEISEHLPAGSQIQLAIPFVGVVAADVRWSHDNRMGCRLHRDFTTGQLAKLILLCAPRSLPGEFKILLVTLAAVCLIAFR